MKYVLNVFLYADLDLADFEREFARKSAEVERRFDAEMTATP